MGRPVWFAQFRFCEVLEFVDEEAPPALARLRRPPQSLEQVDQVELQIAAVGDAGLRIDGDRHVADLDLEGASEAAEGAQAGMGRRLGGLDP